MSSTDTDLPRLLALVEAGYEPEDWGYEPTREVVAALVREVLALRAQLPMRVEQGDAAPFMGSVTEGRLL